MAQCFSGAMFLRSELVGGAHHGAMPKRMYQEGQFDYAASAQLASLSDPRPPLTGVCAICIPSVGHGTYASRWLLTKRTVSLDVTCCFPKNE